MPIAYSSRNTASFSFAKTLLLGGLFCLGLTARSYAQFTPGNLVVLVNGDGVSTLSNASSVIHLEEITKTGTLVGLPLALPVAAAGANHALTQSGTATSEGALALSPNGRFLTLVGYDAPPATTAVVSSSGINRVVARVDSSKTATGINTTTILQSTAAYITNNIRSAVTADGNNFWTAGVGANTDGGIRYVALGNASGGGTQISNTITNTRVVNIFGGQLYTTSATGAYQSVSLVGSGLPITSGQTITEPAGLPTSASDPYAFLLLTISSTPVLYIADETNGLQKYSWNGSTWVSQGSLTGAVSGLTGFYSPCNNNVELYLNSGTGAGNFVYKFVDAAAAASPITSNGSALTAVGTLLLTAPANTVFRGIAFTPGTNTGSATSYAVTGGGSLCAGGSGVAVGLANSQQGFSYQLYLGASPVGSAVTGTGAALSFGPQTGAGTYTVHAVNLLTGCSVTMSGNAVVTVIPMPTVNAGGNGSVCALNTYTLSGATASNYSSITWSTAGNGSFNNIHQLNATYTPGSNDVSNGSVVLTLTAASNSPCSGNLTSNMTLSIVNGGLWNGSSSINWNDAANWCGGVPTATTDVIIPSGTPNQPTVSAVSTCHQLTINSGATVTLSAGGTFNLTGNLTVNGAWNQTGGTLALTGSAQQTIAGIATTSFLINNSGGAVLTGDLTVSGTLTLTSGVINTGAHKINVTNAAAASVTGQSAAAYVIGTLQRSVNATGTYDFPLGYAVNYEPATLTLNSSTGISSIQGTFTTGLPATGPDGATCSINGTPVGSMLNAGYWTLTPDNVTAVNYDLTLQETGYTNFSGPASEIGLIKRHDSSSPWLGTTVAGANGFHSNGNSSIVSGVATVKRTAIPSFSDDGIGFGSYSLSADQPAPDASQSLSLWPSPTDGMVQVRFPAPAASRCIISVSDLTGRKRIEQNSPVVAGSNNITLICSQLPPGIYLLTLSREDGFPLQSVRFIKQ